MRILVLPVLVLLTWPPLAAAEIYRYEDENGRVIFSDQPPDEQATPLELEPLTTVPPRQLQPIADEEPRAQATEPANYESLTIAAPVHDGTVISAPGSVNIRLQSKPALDVKKGHRVHIYLDGKPVQQGLTQLSASLEYVDRGTHQLSARIVDAEGRELIKSDSITFHLRRPFIRP